MQAKHCADNPDQQGLRNGHLEYASKVFTDNAADLRSGSPELQKQAKVCHVFALAGNASHHFRSRHTGCAQAFAGYCVRGMAC